MPRRDKTKPFIFFFLVLPHGVSSGFVSITLPFVLTRAGFSVAIAASIVAIGVSANLWRFLWGPIADLTLTARRWYLIGLSAAALTLFLLGLFPLNPDTVGMLAAALALFFVSDVRLYNGNDQATAALVRPRHPFHVALADSAVHHRFGDVADWRQRDE